MTNPRNPNALDYARLAATQAGGPDTFRELADAVGSARAAEYELPRRLIDGMVAALGPGGADRLRAWMREHRSRNCVPFKGQLPAGPCYCHCADHRCNEISQPQAAPGTCPACRGTRTVRAAVGLGHPRFGQAVPCPRCTGGDEPEAVYLQTRHLHSGFVPAWFDEYQIDRLIGVDSPRSICLGWLGRSPAAREPFVILWGKAGRGKTHAAVGMGLGLIESGYYVHFTTATDLLDRIKASFDDKEITVADVEAMPRSAPVLILDDLWAEQSTEWSRSRLFSILNHRHANRLITIITTNKSPDDPAYREDRLASRVWGDTKALVIRLNGRDHRKSEVEA